MKYVQYVEMMSYLGEEPNSHAKNDNFHLRKGIDMTPLLDHYDVDDLAIEILEDSNENAHIAIEHTLVAVTNI